MLAVYRLYLGKQRLIRALVIRVGHQSSRTFHRASACVYLGEADLLRYPLDRRGRIDQIEARLLEVIYLKIRVHNPEILIARNLSLAYSREVFAKLDRQIRTSGFQNRFGGLARSGTDFERRFCPAQARRIL